MDLARGRCVWMGHAARVCARFESTERVNSACEHWVNTQVFTPKQVCGHLMWAQVFNQCSTHFTPSTTTRGERVTRFKTATKLAPANRLRFRLLPLIKKHHTQKTKSCRENETRRSRLSCNARELERWASVGASWPSPLPLPHRSLTSHRTTQRCS